MTSNQPRDDSAGVWPPAIPSPAPIPLTLTSNKTRLAVASAVAAGLGLICWACAASCLWTLYTVNEDIYWWDGIIHGTYYAGLAFGASGLWLGLLGRKAAAGEIGSALSICVLCLMVATTLMEHKAHQNGQWIWNTGYADDHCHC